ncbi:hypothetical protein RLIN73S_02319 [Rhodanobacter lindaniclasticus]
MGGSRIHSAMNSTMPTGTRKKRSSMPCKPSALRACCNRRPAKKRLNWSGSAWRPSRLAWPGRPGRPCTAESDPPRDDRVHRRLGIGPAAVEQAHHAMVENVGERTEGGIPRVDLAVHRVLGQVQRQRPVRAEQAEEQAAHARRPATTAGLVAVHGSRREGQRGRLAETHEVVAGLGRLTQPRAQRKRALQPPDRLEELEGLGVVAQRVLQRYSVCRVPNRRAIGRPRCVPACAERFQ